MKKQPGMTKRSDARKQPTLEREEWRQQLAALTRDEKSAIVEHLPTNIATLNRWIAGSNTPKNQQTIRNLAKIVPKLEGALLKAFPDAFVVAIDAPETDQIPSSYYEADLRALQTTAEHINFYAYRNQIFEQMVSQLDPGGIGLMIVPIYCVPPDKTGKITKIQVQSIGYGTGPWKVRQVARSFFLGRNSLAGIALERGHPVFTPEDYARVSPAGLLDDADTIQSIGSFPLMKRGNVAGVLSVASVKAGYFSEPRKRLIEKYAALYAAGMQDSLFYSPQQIELEGEEQQEELLQQFSDMLTGFARRHQGLPPEELVLRAHSVIQEYYAKELMPDV